MIKKIMCAFLALSVTLSGCVLTDVFSSAERSDGTFEEISMLEKYDGRSAGIITPVRDQGDSNLCWAYSSSSASEASVLKNGLTDKSQSEFYLNPVATAYRAFKRTSDPLGNTGGDWQLYEGCGKSFKGGQAFFHVVGAHRKHFCGGRSL